jgi:hypothetical protein
LESFEIGDGADAVVLVVRGSVTEAAARTVLAQAGHSADDDQR